MIVCDRCKQPMQLDNDGLAIRCKTALTWDLPVHAENHICKKCVEQIFGTTDNLPVDYPLAISNVIATAFAGLVARAFDRIACVEAKV